MTPEQRANIIDKIVENALEEASMVTLKNHYRMVLQADTEVLSDDKLIDIILNLY
jgi:hypothetical protein